MKYLETLKNISKDNKRKKENLILLLVLLVILLISINYIFNSEDKNKEELVSNESSKTIKEQQGDNSSDIENKIAQVLSQISGVSEVSVIINYSNDGNTNVVYDIKETLNDNGNITSIEKNVAYNEENGDKTAIIQMYNTPTVEGVIVVAKGVGGTDLKQRLSTALGNLLGIASYKVQVFEK